MAGPYYIDPTKGSNGTGTFNNAYSAPPALSAAGETYLFKEGTTTDLSVAGLYINAANITLGAYDAQTGAQIFDKSRVAVLATGSNTLPVNTGGRTGITLDSLEVTSSGTANCIQSIYADSSTALGLAIRRCVLSKSGSAGSPLRATGAGITVEDTDSYSDTTTGTASFYLVCTNAVIRRTNVISKAGCAVNISTTANTNTTPVNATLEDLNVETWGPGASAAYGLFVIGNGITIKNFTSGHGWLDPIFLNGQAITIDGFDISNFDLSRTTGDGIQLADTQDMAGVYIGNGMIIGHRDNPVKQCLIVGNSGAAAQTGRVLIENVNTWGMAFGIICSLPGALIRRVKVLYPTDSGIYLQGSNSTVRDSIAALCGVRGISTVSAATGCKILNNYASGKSSVLGVDNSDAIVKNNIAVLLAGGTGALIRSTAAAATFDYNRYFREDGSPATFYWNGVQYASLAAFKSASSQDAHSSEGDPMLDANFRPVSGSPLIRAGLHLGYGRDFDGKARWNPPTIGAFEAIQTRGALTQLRTPRT